MKKLLVVTLFSLFAVISLQAQCVEAPNDPCVLVHQSTLDKAAKVVDDYKAAKDVIASFMLERAATDKEREAVKSFMNAANSTFDILQKGLVDRDKVIDAAMKVIDKLMAVNERLLAQLDKKPSLWSKFVSVLKTAVLLVTGAAIRGSL